MVSIIIKKFIPLIVLSSLIYFHFFVLLFKVCFLLFSLYFFSITLISRGGGVIFCEFSHIFLVHLLLFSKLFFFIFINAAILWWFFWINIWLNFHFLVLWFFVKLSVYFFYYPIFYVIFFRLSFIFNYLLHSLFLRNCPVLYQTVERIYHWSRTHQFSYLCFFIIHMFYKLFLHQINFNRWGINDLFFNSLNLIKLRL